MVRVTDLDARFAHACELLAGAHVDDAVWELQPEYAAFVAIAVGVRGGPSDADSEAALVEAERSAADLGEVAEVPQVAAWREAFRAFGVKPRSAVSSVEALLRRAGEGLPRIDRLTDHYNALSVRHRMPFGGENLAAYSGPPRLVRADGSESFATMQGGEPADQPPKPGELAWRDDEGVTCRRWNWRQCVRTRLSPEVEDALFIIDGLGPDADAAVTAAGEELLRVVAGFSPGVQTRSRMLTAP